MNRMLRVSLVIAFTIIVSVLVGFWLLLQSGSRISKENFNRIVVRMTLGEVEAILGGPEGDYTLGRSAFRPASHIRGSILFDHAPINRWFGTTATIYVHFDCKGHVEKTSLYDVQLKPWSTWAREKLGI